MNHPFYNNLKPGITRWVCCSLLLLALLPEASFAQTVAPAAPPGETRLGPRDDINPALFYWQAYALLPEFTEVENRRASDRHAVVLNQETRDLAARFDQSFKLLRRAVGSRTFCDWGVDLSLGPEAMLPQLAKAKRLTQASTYRANVYLAEGQEAKAIEDWAAAFVLGRQLSTDGILISALVQVAIENIITSAIAENYYRLSTAGLQDLMTRLEAAPARGTIARCVATEKFAFVDWYVRKMEAIRAEHGKNEAAALAAATELLSSTVGQDERTNMVPALLEAAGGTVSGLIAYIRSADEPYTQLVALCALPYDEYQRQIGPFQTAIEQSNNLLVKMFVPAVMKSRSKEFAAMTRFAMLQAALAYRLHGAAGLERVMDPIGRAPFGYRRLSQNGIDRGFELKSHLDYRGSPEVLIMIETAGVPLRVDGPKAGTPIPTTN